LATTSELIATPFHNQLEATSSIVNQQRHQYTKPLPESWPEQGHVKTSLPRHQRAPTKSVPCAIGKLTAVRTE
jgi:hypothetical protein